MRRLILISGVAVVAATVAAVLSQVGAGGSGKAEIASEHVSALARPSQASDALPANVLDFPFAEHNFATPSGRGSRLVAIEGSLSVYVVPGKASSLCIVEIDEAADTAGGACADRSALRTGSIYMADVRGDGSKDVVGLVGDGAVSVAAGNARARVANNVFVLKQVASDRLTISSATATQTIDLTD